MFERFTADARQAVVLARQEATELHHGYIGCEHLLLALSGGEATPAAAALAACGLRLPDLRERVLRLASPDTATLDENALASLGIDLDAVRRAIEASFGPGALDQGTARRRRRGAADRLAFTPRAKKSLQLALQTAVKAGDLGDLDRSPAARGDRRARQRRRPGAQRGGRRNRRPAPGAGPADGCRLNVA